MDEIDIGVSLTKSIGDLSVPFDWLQNGHPITVKNGDDLGPATIVFAFGNLHTIPLSVEYSDIKSSALPDAVFRQHRSRTNNGPENDEVNDTISIHKSEGVTITRSTQVTTGSSTTVQGGITVAIYLVNANIGISRTETVGFSQNDSTVINTMTDSTETVQIHRIIPPYTIFTVDVEKRFSSDYTEFSGVVEIEGDLLITAIQNGRPTGKYVTLNKLSTYFPRERRTVTLKGQIWNVRGENTNTIIELKPMTNSSKDLLATTKAAPETYKKHNNNSVLQDLIALNGAVDDGGILVTESVFNGSTIHTGNSYAPVKIRAKSMGPGFCSTSVTGGGGYVMISAPPYSWSSWSTLFNSFGSNTASITTSINCDTGALFEIQYYKA